MSLTSIEKIATRYAVGLGPGRVVRSGDFVTIRPKHVMTHDNTAAVIPKFNEIFKGLSSSKREGGPRPPRIHDPHQPVFAIDHDIQNKTPENLGKYAKIEKFATEFGIDFYPAGTGISHQVMVEQGYVVPGSMVVGSDSHSNLYGAMAALGTPVVRTDAASMWATGVTWWQVPPIARVVLKGRLRPGVVGKDIIIALCGVFNHDEVLNHAVEFAGDGVACLSMDQRMSIANMTTEWGALAGIFPFDDVLRDYLHDRASYFAAGRRPGTRRPGSLGAFTREDVDRWWAIQSGKWKVESGNAASPSFPLSTFQFPLFPDPDATYAIDLELDLATVIPHVSGPNDVKTMHSVPEMEAKKVRINKAWLMSCVNARYEDLAEAARIVNGKHVAPGVEFYLAAASADVQERARRDGHWAALVAAGAIELPPGCGTCIGLGAGTIKAGEVGISATNRNFEGRMGDRKGLVYLGSPAVVAASAVAGYICAPSRFEDTQPSHTSRRPVSSGTLNPKSQASNGPVPAVEIIPGFPEVIRARLLFLDRDNLNTDGIYAGKHTYNDAITPDQMAALTFENYDPNFNAVYQRGDVIVSGFNFGTGSSREQAATALKFKGVPCVIGGSFSETYKRNAFNNGFVCFECPELVRHLRTRSAAGGGGSGGGAIVAGEAEIDYRRSVVRFAGRECPFPPLSPVGQELIVAGGAEEVVRRRLSSSEGAA